MQKSNSTPAIRVGVVSQLPLTDPERPFFLSGVSKYQVSFVYAPRSTQGRNAYSRTLEYVRISTQALAAVYRHRLEVLVSNDPRRALFTGILLRLLRPRVRHVIWNFNLSRPYRGVLLQAARFSFSGAASVVVFSRHEADMYRRLFGLTGEQMVFKHFSGPYLDDPRYHRLISLEKSDYVVVPGFSGRDFDLAFCVAITLPSITFKVLAYPWAIGDRDCPANVEIIHGVSELRYCGFIAQARACFLPIRNTTTANGHIAIVQSMSLRTLLITNRTPGTRDYLEDRKNCLLFETQNHDSAVHAVEQAMSNFPLAQEVTETAYRFAQEHFKQDNDRATFDQIVKRHLRVRHMTERAGEKGASQ